MNAGVALTILAVLIGVGFVLGYNALARMRALVKNAWADIDVMLKRRAELVPNLVETAKGYSGFERSVLEEVAAARSRAVNPSLGAGERAKAESELSNRILQINAIAENYPELKSSSHFMQLQEELSTTENKIANARQYYNAAVRDYNTMISTFPLALISGMLGYKQAEHFTIDEQSDREAPSARIR